MAGGWARDDAVNEQIEVSTAEAIARARMQVRRTDAMPAAELCEECNEPIPEARRQAISGVRLCVACQSDRDRSGPDRMRGGAGMNRRASKDSLLK